MKSLRYLFILTIAAGCSSGQKSNEHTMDVATLPPVETRPVKKGQVQVVPVTVNALAEAIKSQNDEQIYKAATSTLVQNPNDIKAIMALGNYHFKKSQPLAAQYFYSKALGLNSRLSEAHSNMGLTYLALGERRLAIKSFRKAIEENSNDSVAAANLGAIYVQEKDYIKASVLLEIAVKKVKDVKILNDYAVSLVGIGRYDQAQGLYKDALDKSSGSKEILFNYAILLIDHLKEPKDGLDLLNKIKFLGPSEYMKNRIIALENKAKAGVK